MTQAEYPGATWMGPPRAYGKGRDGKAVTLSITHYTAGRAGPGAARAGAQYDQKRLDGVSCHAFHDSAETVQEVLTRDRANAAFGQGNRLGIQHELCATVQPRSWWLDTKIGRATLLRGAAAQAWDCMTYDLEPRRLSVDEVRASWDRFPNGPRGLAGHVDITRAFRVGDHTDPGAGFPWDVYEREVQAAMGQPGAKGVKDMRVLQLNVRGTHGTDSSWWATDGLRAKQLVKWEGFGGVIWHCQWYGQEPYDYQSNDVDEFWLGAGRQDNRVDPDPVGVNIAPAGAK